MQADDMTIMTLDGIILARALCPNMEEQHAQALLQQLLAAIEQTPSAPVLLDLSKVATMPSMAIGALVTLWKKLQDGHQRFILVGLQTPVLHTLAVCRLDKLFEFCDSEEEAKIRLRPPAV